MASSFGVRVLESNRSPMNWVHRRRCRDMSFHLSLLFSARF